MDAVPALSNMSQVWTKQEEIYISYKQQEAETKQEMTQMIRAE